MSKETDIIRLLQNYSGAFPNVTLAPGTWAIYGRSLSMFSVEEIDAAMIQLVRACKFFPAIAEIYQAAKSISDFSRGNELPTAAEAWEEVQNLVKTCHIYKPWTYSCDAVRRAVECYGRYELCNLLESEVGIARAQFCKIYNELSERQDQRRKNEEAIEALPKAKREALTGKIVQLAEAKKLREAKA